MGVIEFDTEKNNLIRSFEEYMFVRFNGNLNGFQLDNIVF